MDQIFSLLKATSAIALLASCGYFLWNAYHKPKWDGDSASLVWGSIFGFIALSTVVIYGLETILFFIPKSWRWLRGDEWQQTRLFVAGVIAYPFVFNVMCIPNSAFSRGKSEGTYGLLVDIGQMTENEKNCLTKIIKRCEEALRANDAVTLDQIRQNYDQVVADIRAELEGVQNPRRPGDYELVYRYKPVIIQQINRWIR